MLDFIVVGIACYLLGVLSALLWQGRHFTNRRRPSPLSPGSQAEVERQNRWDEIYATCREEGMPERESHIHATWKVDAEATDRVRQRLQ